MITYHPALDLYHTAYRMIRLLDIKPSICFEIDRIKISDFLFVFPFMVEEIRMPQELRMWKNKFKEYRNPYFYNGDKKLVFHQMESLQEEALRYLSAKGCIDDQSLLAGVAKLVPTETVTSILSRPVDEEQAVILSYLSDLNHNVELLGPKGLKGRTGLMEYRYDPS